MSIMYFIASSPGMLPVNLLHSLSFGATTIRRRPRLFPTARRHAARSAAASASIAQLGETSLQEASLGLLRRQLERPLIGGPGLGAAIEPAVEVRLGRMGEVVVGQFATSKDRVDHFQSRGRSIAHGQ